MSGTVFECDSPYSEYFAVEVLIAWHPDLELTGTERLEILNILNAANEAVQAEVADLLQLA